MSAKIVTFPKPHRKKLEKSSNRTPKGWSPYTDITFVLPFINDVMEGRRCVRRCFWGIKSTGRYDLDYSIGKMLAHKYIKHLLARGGVSLPSIVDDMPRKKKMTGLEIGFLNEIAAFCCGRDQGIPPSAS